MVVARLVAGAFRGARLRGKARPSARSRDASGAASALLVDPGAVPRSRRDLGLGYAGDWRIFERREAKGPASPGRPHEAHAMPLYLRRDAFGFHRVAFITSDEPQGIFPAVQGLVAGAGRYRPHFDHLERLPLGVWRPLS